MKRLIINYVFIFSCLLLLASCTLFKPLPLEAFTNADAVQELEKPGLHKFDGNYEIMTADSNFCTLSYALFYSTLLDSKKQLPANAYINLKLIDPEHLKAKLIVNNETVKQKILKGRLNYNYFEFSTSKLNFAFIINSYSQQSNRLALSKEGDLYLDTNRGGIGFILILPIPLSGSSFDTYNLKFKKKYSGG